MVGPPLAGAFFGFRKLWRVPSRHLIFGEPFGPNGFHPSVDVYATRAKFKGAVPRGGILDARMGRQEK